MAYIKDIDHTITLTLNRQAERVHIRARRYKSNDGLAVFGLGEEEPFGSFSINLVEFTPELDGDEFYADSKMVDNGVMSMLVAMDLVEKTGRPTVKAGTRVFDTYRWVGPCECGSWTQWGKENTPHYDPGKAARKEREARKHRPKW